MRCLTLAEALRDRGAECRFISREHPGHLLEVVRQRGFAVNSLPAGAAGYQPSTQQGDPVPVHSTWLGCDWEADACLTAEILSTDQPDWLVVDHYALDHRWETVVQQHYQRLLVIDDLADRPHVCDILLDQNLGREACDYSGLVPRHCRVMAGPMYALLRPEFAALREYSLQRRREPQSKDILITMGGVDQPNATGQVLEALGSCPLPVDCRINVIMGLQAPWLKQVRAAAAEMPWPTEVLVNISDMAQRMADCDIAIGAAGSTSWERCCLGVPTLMVVLAENQWHGAKALQSAQAAQLVGEASDIEEQLPLKLYTLLTGHSLERMGQMAAQITDGLGAARVADLLERPFTE